MARVAYLLLLIVDPRHGCDQHNPKWPKSTKMIRGSRIKGRRQITIFGSNERRTNGVRLSQPPPSKQTHAIDRKCWSTRGIKSHFLLPMRKVYSRPRVSEIHRSIWLQSGFCASLCLDTVFRREKQKWDWHRSEESNNFMQAVMRREDIFPQMWGIFDTGGGSLKPLFV